MPDPVVQQHPTPQHPTPHHLAPPRPPETPPRQPFPLLASLAPVVGAVVIWAITSSPFALVFAFLGPVIAVASLADARLHGRRTARREWARFRAECEDVAAAIGRAHDRERAELLRVTPGAVAILGGPLRDPERWRHGLVDPVTVSLGLGRVPSSLRIDGTDAEVPRAGLEELAAAATVLDRAPVAVDARLGIGVCGPTALARSVARGILLQVANLLPPEAAEWTAESTAEGSAWLGLLPHSRSGRPAEPDAVVWGDGSGIARVAVASVPALLPHDCRVVLVVGAGPARIVAHPEPSLLIDVEPEFVSAEQAAETAGFLARAAAGRGRSGSELPETIALGDLLRDPLADPPVRQETAARGSLRSAFLVGAHGPVSLDLVADGPHAIVGGMTGSGKSELLLGWLLALATGHPPGALCFLLVDFKGGASFAPIAGLPHVVGLVTDLDERSAHRALLSLRAEVRQRERLIADAAARSIDELAPETGLARLVIVVDEFAALVGGFPELHELFADLAARGRSLGVHLILCTQRPAGAVRDTVLANVPLRLSLRVNNRADSVAVVGTDAASALPPRPVGRVVLAAGGAEPVMAQVALAGAGDVARVAERWAGQPRPRRPWCDELPTVIPVSELPAAPAGHAFGLADLPHQQRQDAAVWDPDRDGNLLVIGAGGSGKSTAASVIARAAGATIVPSRVEEAWDELAGLINRLRRGTAGAQVLVLDDLDALLPRFGDEHGPAFAALLSEALRTGAAAGVHLVLTARRLPGQLQSIAASCDSRIILRQPDRQEHLLAGGDPALFEPGGPPGRGQWRGLAVQIALGPVSSPPPPAAPAVIDPGRWPVLLVVTGRPAELSARLARRCTVLGLAEAADRNGLDQQLELQDLAVDRPAASTAVVGDPDAWHSRWSMLGALRPVAPLLFDRCALTDFRTLSGRRELPPPVEQNADSGWLLEPDGTLTRVRLPG